MEGDDEISAGIGSIRAKIDLMAERLGSTSGATDAIGAAARLEAITVA